MFAYDFGKRNDPACGDCDTDGHCTMNCSPRMETVAMKDVTPKERVRVLAGRAGGPRAEFAPPAVPAPTNLPVPAGPEPTNMLAVIARAAADPRTDTAKMQALLDMQKGIMAEEARLAFISAKLLLNDKLPTINKDGKIEFKDKGQGKATLKFASFENINEIIKPLLKEFGFDLWFSSEPGVAGMINVVGHMEHRLGFFRITTFPMPHDASGGKSGAQGWASAFSFGKRVTTIGLLNIQTKALEDRDRDGNQGNFKPARGGGMAEAPPEIETIDNEQHFKIRELIEWCGVPMATFLDHYGIKKLSDLPVNLFGAAEKSCKDFHANREAKSKHG